jgi:RNA polymerase sigma-70 factor (ECF subfamily)
VEAKPDEHESHLSRIETRWSLVFRAHREDEGADAALRALMQRYGGAVRRYLLASLRDVDAAEDLAQEFAVRFLAGGFRNADPGKGRFRDFVKRAVYHLMVDHHRARGARPGALAEGEPAAAAADPDPAEELDRTFLESWRDELLARAWAELGRLEERSGRPVFTVLRARVDHADLDSSALAGRLSERLGRRVDAGWARVNVHRAREQFIEFLLQEVAASLADPSREGLERELIELGLYEHCRAALGRRRGPGGT